MRNCGVGVLNALQAWLCQLSINSNRPKSGVPKKLPSRKPEAPSSENGEVIMGQHIIIRGPEADGCMKDMPRIGLKQGDDARKDLSLFQEPARGLPGKIFLVGQLTFFVSQLMDICLVMRWNRAIGIPDFLLRGCRGGPPYSVEKAGKEGGDQRSRRQAV